MGFAYLLHIFMVKELNTFKTALQKNFIFILIACTAEFIIYSSICKVCTIKENIEHLFITCTTIQPMWNLINETFRTCGFSQQFNKLKYSVLGDKVQYNMYKDLNSILTFINFAIFKEYCLSNNRETRINKTDILKQELAKYTRVYWKSKTGVVCTFNIRTFVEIICENFI